MSNLNNRTEKLLLSALGSPAAVEDLISDIEALQPNEIPLDEGKIIVGDSDDTGQGVDMSGDATIASDGTVTLENTAVTGQALTGFVSGAGTVSASDTVLTAANKLDGNINTVANGVFTASGSNAETSSADGGAISVTKLITSISTAGAETRTLAAPGSAGRIKIIQMTVDGGDCTLTLTNVVGSGGTTATFDDVGDTLVLMSAASKWVFLGGSATIA